MIFRNTTLVRTSFPNPYLVLTRGSSHDKRMVAIYRTVILFQIELNHIAYMIGSENLVRLH